MLKVSEKWEKRIPLLSCFLIPFLITIIICIAHEVFPFGDRCILHVDMYHQYCPFFTEFMDKLKSAESLQYSWTIGLGSDFVSLYAYYLASPLNWLIILCPRGFVIEFMTILVVLKIALCGLTFGYYLKHHFKTNHFAICIFATAYALSGFMAAYAWNIMWTDCLVLVPLIILGLERLVDEGKAGLYYVTLAVSILSNFYISMIICIFLVIYFLILWIEKKKDWVKTAARFAWYSLLAGGTGAILLIPEAIVLGMSGSQGISFPDTMEWYFNIVAELGRHCVMTENYTSRDHWPNIYSSVFVLLLLVMYLFNKEISWKKKVPRVLFLALFVVSFANNILDFIWHGFHFPNSLPGRQSFLYTFLLLVLGFEAVIKLKGSKVWHVVVSLVANVAFFMFAYKLSDEGILNVDAFLLTDVLLVCYAALLILYLIGNAKQKQWLFLVAMLLVIVELTLHFDMEGLGTTSRTDYVADLADYETVLNEIEEKEAAESQTGAYFYRTEKLERKTKNDAALSGFYSATQFSSLMNINVSHIYQDLGMEGGKNFYCVNGATPLISSMLSLKYVIADNDMEENPIRTLVASSGDTYLYENKYSLPLGFMVEEETAFTWKYDGENAIENQNQLAYLLGAKDAMFTRIDSKSAVGVSTIPVTEDGYIFATYEDIDTDKLTEEVSDGRTKSFTKASHGYTLDLGYCRAGDIVEIKNTEEEIVEITAYVLNMQSLDTAYQKLNEQTMELTQFEDTNIRGTIEVKKSGRLVFSIAKEDGWTLYVDGQETESEMFAEAFLSVHLDEGVHEIELKYETPGLKLGFGISALCVLLFAATMLIKKNRH